MFGAILKATNSSLKKGMTFCRSIYVKKVMKPLAFIFEQPSYLIKAETKHFIPMIRYTNHLPNIFMNIDENYRKLKKIENISIGLYLQKLLINNFNSMFLSFLRRV